MAGHSAATLRTMVHVADVHDDRATARPAFSCKDARHSLRIESVGAQAVHRFRRKCDKFASTQERGRMFDLSRRGNVDAPHFR